MARPLRLHLPGGFYHVTLRGNHRQPIFFLDSDRAYLETVVSDTASRLQARIHAFCWMTNHLHLVVQVSETPLGAIIGRIASRYARTVQRCVETTGHLFERRYHAVLVDADEYLLTLLRYIHLNPVQAGMVTEPAAYRWSSHNSYLGRDQRSWVTTDFALRLLSSTPEQAVEIYRRFMGGSDDAGRGVTDMALPHQEHPMILGSDRFIARFSSVDWKPRSHKTLEDLIADCCARFRVTAEQLAAKDLVRELAAARAWIAHTAAVGQVASICAVARRLGRSEGAIRQLMARHPREPD